MGHGNGGLAASEHHPGIGWRRRRSASIARFAAPVRVSLAISSSNREKGPSCGFLDNDSGCERRL